MIAICIIYIHMYTYIIWFQRSLNIRTKQIINQCPRYALRRRKKKIQKKCVQNEPLRVWGTFMYRFQDVFTAHGSALELFPGNGSSGATQPISQRGMTVQFQFLFHSFFVLLCGNRLSGDSQVQRHPVNLLGFFWCLFLCTIYLRIAIDEGRGRKGIGQITYLTAVAGRCVCVCVCVQTE